LLAAGVCNHLDPREGVEAARMRENCLRANRLKSLREAFFGGIAMARHRNLDDKHMNALNTTHLQRRSAGGCGSDTGAIPLK